MNYTNTMLRLVNADRLITDRVVAALKRQEQIDDLQDWYEGASPFSLLHELAESELKHAVETTALVEMTEQDYAAFRRQWYQITPEEQRALLCELAGLPDPERYSSLDA